MERPIDDALPGAPPGVDEPALNVEALAEFVASVQHLPLFTGTAVQLIRSVDREDVTSGELAKLVSTDAALSAHLLRIVNSPFYGLARRIGTVSDALAVLGFNLVRRTVTAAVLQRPLLAYLHDTAVARAFWRHHLLCAALARHIAAQRGVDGEFAYMAGLLHDVGRLVMLMQFPEQSYALLERRGDDDLRLLRERALFGFDHADVGAGLLESWGLPQAMVQSAHLHAGETEPEDAIAASVWRANLIAHEMEDELDGRVGGATAHDGRDDAGDAADDGDVRPWMASIGLTDRARRQMFVEIAALESDRG